MHSVRSAKSYYVAAFILGAVLALLIVSPARSAESFPLDHRPLGREALFRSVSAAGSTLAPPGPLL